MISNNNNNNNNEANLKLFSFISIIFRIARRNDLTDLFLSRGPLKLLGDGENGVPATDAGVGLRHHVLPVLFPGVVRDLVSYVDHAHHVVAGETVVVHHQDLQRCFLDVHVAEVELERLVEDRDERVSLYFRLPFLVAMASL